MEKIIKSPKIRPNKQITSKVLRRRETVTSYLFLAPALAFFAMFVAVPLVWGIITSFFNYGINNFDFVGVNNYINLMKDEHFWKSLQNTLVLVVGVVPVIVIFSVYVSVVIYEKSAWIRSTFRAIFYLPVVTGSVAVTVVWSWIFDPYSGILNWLLMNIGAITEEIQWLADKRFALLAILLVLVTTSVGQPIVLFIAALGNLDKSHIEAAEIDGASKWQVFRHVKWPGILPTTLYVIVITTINSFQCFSLVQLLTAGGPNFATSTLMYLLYQTAFTFGEFGYANAIGVILAIIIGIISLIQFKAFGTDVEY
ncbi:MAG: sugar ABC transporter permease [Clostridia bacterium]